jgi:OmcA/MtrC family decaheme c-type cytochrome
VGFPQDLRNCTKCHDGNKAPQADNWKTKPSKQACLTCHQTGPASNWYAKHVTGLGLYPSGDYNDITNTACANCHGAGQPWSPDRMHFNQAEVNAAKYKMNIESVTYDSGTRNVTIVYYMSDPTNGGAKWDLCAAPIVSTSNRLYLGYQNVPNQSTSVTEFSSYNNGGSGVRINWCDPGNINPVNDGTNKYTAVVPIPADVPGESVLAGGTGRVISSGSVKEPATDVDGNPTADPVVTVSVQNTFKDFAISGSLTPRRVVVSNAKCNACHSTLGTAAGSNTHLNAFHGGARNFVEACVICHDPGRVSSTVMSDGSAYFESYQFKRMIHGLHASPTSVRTYPLTHDNVRPDAYDKKCVSTTDMVSLCNDGTYDYGDPNANISNWAEEVAWPGIIGDCNTCHVNDSWKQDRSVLGSVITGGATNKGGPDAVVISPKAATCTSCHDGLSWQNHVRFSGGGAFGTDAFGTVVTQGSVVAGGVAEICEGCHKPGSGVTAADISLVHDVK